MRNLTFILFLVSLTFFVLGLSYPILSTKKQIFGFVLKYRELKLFDSVSIFYNSKDYFLAFIILFFTIVFPIIKFMDLFNKIIPIIKPSKKLSSFLQLLDKWSMLDVFLLALLLLNFKMDSNIIVMKLKIGISFIALSILLRMVVTILINKKRIII